MTPAPATSSVEVLDKRLRELSVTVQHAHEVIDERLNRPASWVGTMRRETAGHAQEGDGARYRKAYERCSEIALEPDWQPCLQTLLMVNRLVGGDGRLRDFGVRVGNFTRFPAARRLPQLISEFLKRCNSESELPIARALRLHLDLITAHPFADANGRSSRLIASMCLISAGYRSTLVAAIEEAFGSFPWLYNRVLERFWSRHSSEAETLNALISQYLVGCSGVAMVRLRKRRLLRLCDQLCIERSARLDLMRRVDIGDASDGRTKRFRNAMVATNIKPWRVILSGLHPYERATLKAQLLRLRREEDAEWSFRQRHLNLSE